MKSLKPLLACTLSAFVPRMFYHQEEMQKSSLLLHNGKIWTGNSAQPWADWVYIEDDKIVDLGQGNTSPKATESIDLKGRLALPGFNDSHVHFAQAGALLLGINLLDVNDDESFIQRVEETTKRLPKGSWITRGDWGAYEAWNAGSQGGRHSKGRMAASSSTYR